MTPSVPRHRLRSRLFCLLLMCALPAVAAAASAAPEVTEADDTPTTREVIEQVSERESAPLYSRRLWSAASRDWQRSAPRVQAGLHAFWQALRDPFAHGGARVWIGLIAALLFWCGAVWAVPRLTARLRPRLPEGRVRRSLPALLNVVGVTLVSSLAITGIEQALQWGGAADAQALAILQPLLAMVVFAAFMISLGRNVLSCNDGGWRLPNIPDEVAASMRHVPQMLAIAVAVATGLEIVSQRFLTTQGSASALASAALTLFLCTVMASVWSRLALALRNDVAEQSDTQRVDERHLFVLRAVVLVGWGLIIASVLATLLGYFAAGSFLIKQTLWGCVVLVFVYLLATASGDVIDAYLRGNGPAGIRLSRRLGLEPRKVDQIGALVYGAVRLLLIIGALLLLAAPYGLGPAELFGRLHPRTAMIAIGQLRFGPADVVKALLVFLAVMLATRLFGRWFSRRYLPTTRLDPGMRSSLASVAGYVGVVVAISMALAAMGIGLEKITWIASALTVGIGFGLQAIVQNFISGLILLAERPVRVGDWVVVGDAEGDVRRINVRATEITTADRTTVLVPNSELITKVVRNRTLTRSEGLVKILLPLPAATTDIEKTFAIIREIIAANADVLKRPEPAVMVEEVRDNGKVFINVSVYVEGPRRVANVRSALLYEILRRLPAEGVPLA
ncbi:mechanosensitive ion channel domain-containing protein [Pseudoxanthomonas indica]|uniref:Mechanosensitive ion channel n=1 Tax=Pseudoxanthomonas indica TaxID=428993 RepID=A0A1T5ITI0_9GAMM|nr:mechanosensitive ion channel domain-containing protein [Pseudoxanthomonas indica]SKC42278.1 Mechanosensitive ion channel [Pseudoxanthomonas indica]